MKREPILIEVKELIEQAGISQRKVAKQHLDITAPHLSAVLNGLQPLSKKLRKKMLTLRDRLINSGLVAS